MNMYYGQTQMHPQQYGYQQAQPQYQTASANNIQIAVSLVQPAINHLIANRMITPQEGQHLLTGMSNNHNNMLGSFQQSVIKTYGEVAVSQNELLTFAVSKLQHAANALRGLNSMQNTSMMQNQTINNPGSGMYMNNIPQQMPQAQGSSTIADIYGTGQPMNNAQTANQNHPLTVIDNPTSQPTPQITHTNRPHSLDLTEDVVWFPPTFTVVPPARQCNSTEEEILGMEDIMVVSQSYSVANNSDIVEVNIGATVEPVTSIHAAMNAATTVMDRNKENSKQFIDVVSFEEICPLDMDYESGKRIFEMCKEAYGKQDIGELIKVLEKEGTDAQVFIQYMLWLFNQAATVCFMRVKEETGKVLKLNPIRTLAELSRLITDAGDYTDWTDEPDKFKRSLSVTIRASIGRMFRKDFKGYLDITEYKDQAIILSSDELCLKFSDGSTNRTVHANMADRVTRATDEATFERAKTTNAKIQTEINNKLKNKFPLLIQRKIAIHNLEVTDTPIAEDNFKARLLRPAPNTMLWDEMFKREGIMELIRTSADVFNPILLGKIYTDSLIARRVVR